MTRVLTGVLLAALACYLIFWSPGWLFQVAAVAVGLICYFEYTGLVTAHGLVGPLVFGYLTGVAVIAFPQYLGLSLSLLSIAALAFALRSDTLRTILPGAGAAIFGAIYTCLPWHFAGVLRGISVHWLFFALALNWSGDTVAYYTGRAFGKHRLAPVVSPKKSWEGAAGSVVGSVIFGLVYMGYFEPLTPAWKIATIAIVANIAGQVGDLAESAMKRGAGIKDSGHILPGHGGLLDRVDSSLFALPVVLALTRLL
jgi:phosphatidate cytidylyltransferase